MSSVIATGLGLGILLVAVLSMVIRGYIRNRYNIIDEKIRILDAYTAFIELTKDCKSGEAYKKSDRAVGEVDEGEKES